MMKNYCSDCEYRETCEIADITNFCEDCKDYYTCDIQAECGAGHSVECNNGFEDRNEYEEDEVYEK